MTPIEWLLGGDTGQSSKTICMVMTQSLGRGLGSTPSDADDFGRCHRLLLLFPQWRDRLDEVAHHYKAWGPLVAAWDELTALYLRCSDDDGRLDRSKNRNASDALYKRISALNDGGRIADGWKQTSPGSWSKGNSFSIKMGAGVRLTGGKQS